MNNEIFIINYETDYTNLSQEKLRSIFDKHCSSVSLTYNVADYFYNLQQENKQLREELKRYKQIYRENPTLYDEIAPYIIKECELENKLDLYKSVIHEIREHMKYLRSLNNIYFCDIEPLEKILDKIKEY